MEQWIINLVYERAELEADILKLGYYLGSNSASVVNKGDNMYMVMQSQLRAMKDYQSALLTRINLIKQRLDI